jgi:hypothetical protein
MIEVGVAVGDRVGTGLGVRVGTGVNVGVGKGVGACVGATVCTGGAVGAAVGATGGAGGSVGAFVAGAASCGAAAGPDPGLLSVGVVWFASTTPWDGAGADVTFGSAFVFGVALVGAGKLLGAVIEPRAGGVIAAGRTTISAPMSRPITAPARLSRS